MRLRAAAAALTFALATSVSSSALADKVAVLAFGQASSAGTKEQVDAARAATRSAVTSSGHTLPSDAEMLTAEMAVKDGVPDTSDEYRAAGRASGSAWTVSGRVEPRASGRYRLELEVCQVGGGRVESLAREIDPAVAPQQIGEMLALLVRPEGLGTSDIPWEHAAPPPPAPPAPPPPPPKPEAPAAPPPPPAKPAPRHIYAEGHPLLLGASLEAMGAIARPSNAQGSSASLFLGGSLGYALDAVPGLELRADVAGALVGPQALLLDGGARYAFMLAPKTTRLYAGPEVGLGAFVTLGADKTARFLGRGGGVVGMGLGPQAAVELFADLDWAPGGAGALLLGGGGARGIVRF